MNEAEENERKNKNKLMKETLNYLLKSEGINNKKVIYYDKEKIIISNKYIFKNKRKIKEIPIEFLKIKIILNLIKGEIL